MKTFNIYRHPTQGIEAVKVGFSWPAFFFGPFWMLAKRLWEAAGAWFVLCIVLVLIEGLADQSRTGGVQALVYLMIVGGNIALGLVPAFMGNKWREQNLSSRGFEQFATVRAETPDGAVAQASRSSLTPHGVMSPLHA